MLGFLVFVVGLVFGSFLNVLIYRIPLKQSVVTEPSHCTVCNTRIKWYDLIPVVSYIMLKGKCRTCKTRISPRYPLVELTNGIGWLMIYLLFSITIKATFLYMLFSTALVFVLIKYDKMSTR